MALITLDHVSFTYDGSYDPVFEDLSTRLDTDWRLGLIGRNGKGKTTLLRILAGELTAQGTIEMPLTPALFPISIADAHMPAMQAFLHALPDAPEWRLAREAALLEVPAEALDRPLDTLSRGEQTKMQLAALFAREDAYPMIDEPTNHLDLRGRALVGEYLSRKDGFLLVSHDRSFVNACVDHTLSLNRQSITVMQGGFDTWSEQMERKNASEQARNEQIKRDVKRLKESARQQADWSAKSEKGKFHVPESNVASVDRGFVGKRAAKMMNRSLATQRRIERQIEEKNSLLKDVESVGTLKLAPLRHPKQNLIEVTDGSVRYGERVVCDNIQFSLLQGERVALTGRNGAGKSSVLLSLCGESDALHGQIHLASGLVISHVPQSAEGVGGSLRDFIRVSGADETLFKAILRNMDFGREQFDKHLEDYSEGQKKKLLLARSLCQSAHVYIWDEPMNYIDVFSRMQLEQLLLAFQPTMLLVEHDRAFLQRVCTRIVDLG